MRSARAVFCVPTRSNIVGVNRGVDRCLTATRVDEGIDLYKSHANTVGADALHPPVGKPQISAHEYVNLAVDRCLTATRRHQGTALHTRGNTVGDGCSRPAKYVQSDADTVILRKQQHFFAFFRKSG